jgi:lipopolysaccharide/colanic/teichoic acid biosynthesis glycosyltransferase
MKKKDILVKRVFDILLSSVTIIAAFPIIIIAWVLAAIETRGNGFFMQTRIGKNGKPFAVVKIKTMKPTKDYCTFVTVANDQRITYFGRWMRRYKIDELPQLFNIIIGQMSFVGPRPDVPGYADKLTGEDRIILSISPGITGPASLKYKDEEYLLEKQKDPEHYNRNVIWPDKVNINKKYIKEWSFKKDMQYIVWTLVGKNE